ncbi:hypothetical protein E4U61_006403 [Claviceps capensis]|nr:hypothetical protein E4U61_006403 [Claviceps capensis]
MRRDFDSEPHQRGPEDAINVYDEIPARKPPGERISSQILARPRSTIAPDIKKLEPHNGKKYTHHASLLVSFDGRNGKKILDPHSSQIEVESQVRQIEYIGHSDVNMKCESMKWDGGKPEMFAIA